MAQTIADMSVEELELAIRRKTAQQRKQELETQGVEAFKAEVVNASDVDSLYRLALNFKWKVEQFRRVLNPPTGSKRGRKPKIK